MSFKSSRVPCSSGESIRWASTSGFYGGARAFHSWAKRLSPKFTSAFGFFSCYACSSLSRRSSSSWERRIIKRRSCTCTITCRRWFSCGSSSFLTQVIRLLSIRTSSWIFEIFQNWWRSTTLRLTLSFTWSCTPTTWWALLMEWRSTCTGSSRWSQSCSWCSSCLSWATALSPFCRAALQTEFSSECK